MNATRCSTLLLLTLASCTFDMTRERPGVGDGPRAERIADAPAPDAAGEARGDRTADRALDLKLDGAKQDAARPDAPKPDGPKLDQKKADAPKPDQPVKPDLPKPDLLKPDLLKPDLTIQLVTWIPGGPTSGTASVTCAPAYTVGGGGSCGPGLDALYAFTNTSDTQAPYSYHAACNSGSPTVWAACVDQLTFGNLYRVHAPGSSSATCTAGDHLLGGSCSCGTGTTKITASYPDASETWKCICQGPNPGTTQAICLQGSLSTNHWSNLSTGTSCPAGRLLAGGCHCNGYPVTESQPSGNGWSCGCAGAPTPTSYVICGTQP